MIKNNENIMGNSKFFSSSVDFKESDEKIALKFALLQKGCASWGILETIYTVVDECIEFGIHGAFNRVIRSLLESSTAKVDNVISNFTRMSKFKNTSHKTTINKITAVHIPDIMLHDKQDTSLDRSGECKPPRNCPKRSEAVSQ